MGRPSIFTDDIANEICYRLAEGETLRKICRDDHMPAASTVILWCNTSPAFSERYARARSEGMDVMAEDIVEISDDKTDDPQSRRVRVDARKWLLSKMRPEKYSDRLAITGAKDAEPLKVLVEYADKSVPE